MATRRAWKWKRERPLTEYERGEGVVLGLIRQVLIKFLRLVARHADQHGDDVEEQACDYKEADQCF